MGCFAVGFPTGRAHMRSSLFWIAHLDSFVPRGTLLDEVHCWAFYNHQNTAMQYNFRKTGFWLAAQNAAMQYSTLIGYTVSGDVGCHGVTCRKGFLKCWLAKVQETCMNEPRFGWLSWWPEHSNVNKNSDWPKDIRWCGAWFWLAKVQVTWPCEPGHMTSILSMMIE